jgi:LPS export ABC transporter protein LptC
MKPTVITNFTVASLIFILISASLSCKKGIRKQEFDIENLPSLTVKYDTTVYFDSGRVVLKMTFPLMEQYDNVSNPYSEFKMGFHVDFFDSGKEPSGLITAKYAKYLKNENLWELRDSVVVINENADKLETELLFWDEPKDLIYTDQFVRFTNVDQTMEGTSFQSDTRLRKRVIRGTSATIYINEDREEPDASEEPETSEAPENTEEEEQ